MKTLVVEDDATQRLFLKTFFEKLGECEVAETAQQAETLYKKAMDSHEPFSLVCLDLMLPDKSGQELLQLFRAEEKRRNTPIHQRCRILMVTALGDLKHVTEAFAADCDGYLVKPVDTAKLKEKLKSLGLVKPT